MFVFLKKYVALPTYPLQGSIKHKHTHTHIHTFTMQSVITGSIEGVIADMVKPYVAPPTEQVRHYRFQCETDTEELADIALGLMYTYSETEKTMDVRIVYATTAGVNCQTNTNDLPERNSLMETDMLLNESWPVHKKDEKGQYQHVHTVQIYELSFDHFWNTHDYGDDKTHQIKLIVTSVPGQAPTFKLVSLVGVGNDGLSVDLLREADCNVTFAIRECDDPVHAVGAPLLPTH